MNNIKEIEVGDIFSEISHYTVLSTDPNGVTFKHHESGQSVTLDNKYVEELLATADQYETEVEVTKEDGKPDADGNVKKGIRSIFEGIHSSEVFTVCFKKQDTPLSAKKLKELKDAQISTAIQLIEDAQKNKKGVANIAKIQLEHIQNNAILPYEPGEDRILRGFKIDFSSVTGMYRCVDMDIVETKTGTNIRPVNITTIQWLVFKGVKYIVKTK